MSEQFKIYDAEKGEMHIENNARSAVAKAKEIGAESFSHTASNGDTGTIKKFDGEWHHTKQDPYNFSGDGLIKDKPLSFKTEIEQELRPPAQLTAYDTEEGKTYKFSSAEDALEQAQRKLRAEIETSVADLPPDEARARAFEDARKMQKLSDENREFARDYISFNMSDNEHYKETINKEESLKSVSKEIAEFEKLQARLISEKEERKGNNGLSLDTERAANKENQKAADAASQEPPEATRIPPADANLISANSEKANGVGPNEPFTSYDTGKKPILPEMVERDYELRGTEMRLRNRPEQVAFHQTDSTLDTNGNDPKIIADMVKTAKARGWDDIQVRGSESFKSQAWLEAASQNMTVKGYTPNEQDKAKLAARRPELDARGKTVHPEQAIKPVAADTDRQQRSKAEEELLRSASATLSPSRQLTQEEKNKDMARAFQHDKPEEALKKYPELSGSYAAAEAARREANRRAFSPQQREQLMNRMNANITKSIEKGVIPKIEVEEKREVKIEKTTTAQTSKQRDLER